MKKCNKKKFKGRIVRSRLIKNSRLAVVIQPSGSTVLAAGICKSAAI